MIAALSASLAAMMVVVFLAARRSDSRASAPRKSGAASAVVFRSGKRRDLPDGHHLVIAPSDLHTGSTASSQDAEKKVGAAIPVQGSGQGSGVFRSCPVLGDV